MPDKIKIKDIKERNDLYYGRCGKSNSKGAILVVRPIS